MRKPNNAVLLVGCGASKVWRKKPALGRVPAKDAYTSSLFRLCRAYAEKYYPGRWVIISAKYGLLDPSTLIANYDAIVNESMYAATIRRVRVQWRTRFAKVRAAVTFAGANYNQILLQALSSTVTIKTPLQHCGLFQRLAWLKRAVSARDLLKFSAFSDDLR